jgi:hypothetical protein
MLHSDPERGRSASRQDLQTGSLEIRIRGALQMRQSAGKNVKNRLAAARSAQWREPAAWPCAGGIRKPVLLKTASRIRTSSLGALAGLSVVSIAVAWGVMQRVCEYGSHLRIGCRLALRRLPVPVWGRSEICKHDGSSVRTERVAASEKREIRVRRFLDSASDKLSGRGNLSNGIPGRCGTKGIRGETRETSEPVCFILTPTRPQSCGGKCVSNPYCKRCRPL